MFKRMSAALAVLMLFTLSIRAQDAKPDYDVKISGDGQGNVEFKIVTNKPADQSSARATVETYNRVLGFVSDLFFYEGYPEFKKQAEVIGETVERAVSDKFFTGDCLDEMLILKKKKELERKEKEAADIKDGMTPRRRIPAKVTGEKAEGALTVVEVEEGNEYSTKNKDGKWETTTTVNKVRFSCSAKDGKWLIEKIEKYGKDYSAKPDEKGEYPMIWKEEKTMASLLGFMAGAGTKAPPMPEVDTPEKFARAAFCWLGLARRAANDEFARSLFSQVLDLFKPLFTEQHLKDALADSAERAKQDAEYREKEAKEKAERKITSKAVEGGTEVTIAARSKWSAEIVLTVIKTDEGLRIKKAVLKRIETKYDDKGNAVETEKLEPMSSPSDLEWN